MILKMTVQELKEKMDKGDPIFLLDVRRPEERDICKLEDEANIPLHELEERIGELDPNVETIIYCRSGGRSMQACQFLDSKGFKKVINVTGGVLAWSDFVDPDMPKY
ncbi:MAG: rhodanese-like domain-containing protein [Bdellovibrionota bacterium]